jgi:magnesium-dependent phosphatase 1
MQYEYTIMATSSRKQKRRNKKDDNDDNDNDNENGGYDLRLAVFDLDYTIWQPEMYQIHGPPQLRKRTTTDDTGVEQTTITEVTDRNNVPITIFDGASYALQYIHKFNNNKKKNRNKDDSAVVKNHTIQAAIASKTDEPKWAKQCMDWLTIDIIIDDDDDDNNNNNNDDDDDDGEDENEDEDEDEDEDHDQKKKKTTTQTVARTRRKMTLSECFDSNLIEMSFSNKREHFQRLHKKTNIPYQSMVFFDNEYSNITSVQKLGVQCIYTPNGMTKDAWEDALIMFDI